MDGQGAFNFTQGIHLTQLASFRKGGVGYRNTLLDTGGGALVMDWALVWTLHLPSNGRQFIANNILVITNIAIFKKTLHKTQVDKAIIKNSVVK